MDIIYLAKQATLDTKYLSTISALVGGQELPGPLSAYKPLSLHMTVQDFSTGQLIITNDKKIVVPKIKRITF